MTICRRCYWFKQRQPTFGTCWHPATYDQTVGVDEPCRHDGFTPKVVWVERKAKHGEGAPARICHGGSPAHHGPASAGTTPADPDPATPPPR